MHHNVHKGPSFVVVCVYIAVLTSQIELVSYTQYGFQGDDEEEAHRHCRRRSCWDGMCKYEPSFVFPC